MNGLGSNRRLEWERRFPGPALRSCAEGMGSAGHPAWRFLGAGLAAGIALLWWVESDAELAMRSDLEVAVVLGIFGFMAGWLRVNREALTEGARAEAAAQGQEAVIVDCPLRGGPYEGRPAPHRLWYEGRIPMLMGRWRELDRGGLSRVSRAPGRGSRADAWGDRGSAAPVPPSTPGTAPAGSGAAATSRQPASAPFSSAVDPVCPVCGNISVRERKGVLVCEQCGYTITPKSA